MNNGEKKKILYINYIDFSQNASSGSGVRPYRFFKEFENTGCELTVLSGNQASADRPRKIKEIYAKVKENKPDLCYIESPTYPILRHADRSLIKKLHKLGVPTGYFYRDFYRKFPEQFPKRSSFMGRIKDLGLDLLQKLTNRVLRYCDVVYFPSLEAAALFDYKKMKALPPAGENRLPSECREQNHTAIYVGGISGHYDGELLLDAFASLSATDPSARLILVCREDEWGALTSPHKNAEWLDVHHASGEGLIKLYNEASVALVVPKKSMPYNDLAVSVKIFEYISYGLPVITLDSKAMSRIVNDEGLGLVASPDAQSLCESIEKMFNDKELYECYSESVRKALLNRNLWGHRVEQIVNDLCAQSK